MGRGRHHVWRIEKWAYERFWFLLDQLKDHPADSEEAHQIREDIRGLPGFPKDMHPDLDTCYFEFTDKSFMS